MPLIKATAKRERPGLVLVGYSRLRIRSVRTHLDPSAPHRKFYCHRQNPMAASLEREKHG